MGDTDFNKNQLKNLNKKKTKRPDKKLYILPTHLQKKNDNIDDKLNKKKNKINDNNLINEKIVKETIIKEKKKTNEIFDLINLKLNLEEIKNQKNNDFFCYEKSTDEVKYNENEKSTYNKKIYYDQFKSNNDKNYEDLPHVLEIFNISNETKTQDLITSLNFHNSKEFEIRWVNESNAIVIFSSKDNALEALKMTYHNLKLRKLSQATLESKVKAKEFAILPYKKRPETSACLARRLVSGALGIKLNLSVEQKEAERKKLQDAKERKKNKEKLQKDAWEGK